MTSLCRYILERRIKMHFFPKTTVARYPCHIRPQTPSKCTPNQSSENPDWFTTFQIWIWNVIWSFISIMSYWWEEWKLPQAWRRVCGRWRQQRGRRWLQTWPEPPRTFLSCPSTSQALMLAHWTVCNTNIINFISSILFRLSLIFPL